MKIGRRIYYDISTGNAILDTGERRGYVTPSTMEKDIVVYNELSERNRETFDYVELEYGQYTQDFAECNGFRVNPETKEIEFSYPDPNEEEPQEPVYQKPLSEEVSQLRNNLDSAIIELTMAMFMQGGM